MIRPNELVLPLLRAAFPTTLVVSYFPQVDSRSYPMILSRPNGGARHPKKPNDLALMVLELSTHTATDLAATETLYYRALDVLYGAWQDQTVIDGRGWIHSITETMGPTQLDPLFEDTWRVQGLIRIGLRPTTTSSRS